ncbi:hypothetical protein A2Y85_04020 [candidate division WOR-3 bacterium RBG_13_43_14]|uniref:CheW-like domain-containing protein n=1 Tax=candidate division WOR-3 bacterium RBG_13_43_14 TaxID=1802590 RepID=A0A1F4U9R6_UNCW3|nr:MAG: hypothetical protein A2Y85_04020 [candidate division WOR-3 bacterium RBG_13_43_14]
MKKKRKKDNKISLNAGSVSTEKPDPGLVLFDYSTFKVGNEFFAIVLGEITEILHDIEIEKIAHLSEYYCGTIRYRGATLPVIDMCKVLKHDRPSDSINTCLLMKGYEGLYAMLVDSDVDIIKVKQEHVQPLPDCYSPEEAGILDGILVHGDNLYGILNSGEIYTRSKTKEV